MYEIDPRAGEAWLAALLQTNDAQASNIVRVQPRLRESDDGTTDIFTTVVLRDSVMQLSSPERQRMLGKLEDMVKRVILSSQYSDRGWPLISFMTEADVLRAAQRGRP